MGCLLLVLTFATCGCRGTVRYSEMSGFLEDYSILRKDDKGFAYQNPGANWASYDKVLLDPVTLWYGGDESLDEITEQDLLRLASMLHHEMLDRLEKDYVLVQESGPGVMHVSLALTAAEESDTALDILMADVSDRPPPLTETAPLAPGTKKFVNAAKIEGEIRDAGTEELLVAAVRLGIAARGDPGGEVDSWDDVERAFESWAESVQEWLRQARSGESCDPAGPAAS